MEYGVAQMFPISVPIFNVIEDTDELTANPLFIFFLKFVL